MDLARDSLDLGSHRNNQGKSTNQHAVSLDLHSEHVETSFNTNNNSNNNNNKIGPNPRKPNTISLDHQKHLFNLRQHQELQKKKPNILKFVSRTKSKLKWWNPFRCLANKSQRFTNLTLVQICQDWLFLALLGIIMALLSFSMDTVISLFLRTRLWLYSDISGGNLGVQYLGWCTMPIVLVAFSTGFVHVFSPAAVGSGIPEMKTILRGVILNEYLTFRTLIGKIVGLTFTLGSGLPLGKEGPFVHMASIVATLLSKLVASFQGIYENESRTSEMLSAACAVGVAATFYAPIGGVLFSIEITTVYFAVRNYWRGFFAACCGATVWRLLSFWIENDESISAIFKTNFKPDFPFDPIELVAFSFIGATCGLAGAGYIKFHREIVRLFRRHPKLSEYLHKNFFVYPIVVTLIITTVTFPPFLGKYTASTLSTHDTIEQLFSNKTWSLDELDLETETMLNDWTTPNTGFHLHLILYIVMKFWTSALASTIPIPSGLFIPVLKMGAAYGRLLGEIMAQLFPDGINYGDYVHPAAIVPGSYAVVGAAAFSGAVTHTISTSVILFEMTGQIVHIIPVILAVLIANAVCQSLQPSIYDSIIEAKKLPYLPPIASSNSISHKILVRDFMTQKIAFIWKHRCTHGDLKTILRQNKRVISFPLVQSPETMILLGSISRVDLLKLLYLKLGREQRLQEFRRRTSIEGQQQHHHNHLVSVVSGNKFNHLNSNDNDNNNNNNTNNDYHKQDISNQEDQLPRGILTVANNKKNQLDLPSDYYHDGTPSLRRSIDLNERRKSQLKRAMSIDDDDNDCHHCEHEAKLRGSAYQDPLRTARTSIVRPINLYNEHSVSEYQDGEYDMGGDITDDEIISNGTPSNQALAGDNKDDLDRVTKNGESTEFSTNTTTSSDDEVSRENSSEDKTIASQSPQQDTNLNNSNLSSATDLELAINGFDNQLVDAGLNKDTRLSPTRSILKSPIADNARSESDRQENPRRKLKPLMIRADSTNTNPGLPKKKRSVRLPRLRVIDTTPEEQEEWERDQLQSYVDFSRCQVDAAPFQLVEQTSLYRVHTLFSMLGLNHAYVTSVGRLVGIVALRDIRYAIEEMNNGDINLRKNSDRSGNLVEKKISLNGLSGGHGGVVSFNHLKQSEHHTSTDEELYSRV